MIEEKSKLKRASKLSNDVADLKKLRISGTHKVKIEEESSDVSDGKCSAEGILKEISCDQRKTVSLTNGNECTFEKSQQHQSNEPINESEKNLSEHSNTTICDENPLTLNSSDLVHNNAKKLADVFSVSASVPLTTTDISRLNRERGSEIVVIAGRYQALVDSASRSPAANMERNKIWREITEQINKKYPNLNPLSYEQCKKLCKYYKRKDTSGYSQSLSDVREERDKSDGHDVQSQSPHAASHFGEAVDDSELMEANEIVDEICHSDGRRIFDVIENNECAVVRENDKPSEGLLKFLAKCSASTSFTTVERIMGESSCGLLNQKKSERGRYICQLSDSLSATLQSSSRLYQSNVERAGAWDQITSMVNERYGEELGSLTTEQTRRIYTSLKRKLTKNRGKVTKTNSTEAKLQHDRVKVNGIVPDESEADGSACSGTLSRLTSMSPNRSGEIFAESLMECATKPKPREVIHLSKHSTDKKHGASSRCLPVNNLSTIELLALLAQRDAEIRQLKNRLMQKSVEHQLRVSRLIEKMAEVVKIAVNDSVQREIMGALDQDVFICGDITNDETFDDNEV